MSAVDRVREDLGQAREEFTEAVDPATFAFVVGVGVAALVWAVADGDGTLGLAAVLGAYGYGIARVYAKEDDPTADPARRSISGEVRQVLTPESEEFDDYALGDHLRRRVDATGEAVVVVETTAPENAVARWFVRRFPVNLLESFVAWFTGGRLRFHDTEVVLLEEPPAEGDHVGVPAREATVEVVLEDAHEPTSQAAVVVEEGSP